MNSKLKTAFRIYEIFSVCLISILIIAALIIWINIGRITVFAVEKALDSYNAEITEVLSDFIKSSGGMMGVKSIRITNEGGVQALRVDLSYDKNDFTDINEFRDKNVSEIVSEHGITSDDIPPQLKTLVESSKLAVDIFLFDETDSPELNRLITSAEIAEFLKR